MSAFHFSLIFPRYEYTILCHVTYHMTTTALDNPANLPPFNSGEQTAQILESSLTSLESKLDALLASFEAQDGEREIQITAADGGAAPANDEVTREEEDDKEGK